MTHLGSSGGKDWAATPIQYAPCIRSTVPRDSLNAFDLTARQPGRGSVVVVESDRCVEIARHGRSLGRLGCQVIKLGL
jgi:hypothetical protein